MQPSWGRSLLTLALSQAWLPRRHIRHVRAAWCLGSQPNLPQENAPEAETLWLGSESANSTAALPGV